MIDIDISVIGENSSNRMKLIKNVNKALKELKYSFNINIIEDEKSLEIYKGKNTPILIINKKIVSNGKVPTDKEVKHYIKLFA